MQEFYKNSLIGLLVVIAASLLVGYVCIDSTYLRLSLLPAASGAPASHLESISDAVQGGHSSINLLKDKGSFSFDYTMLKKVDYPFVTATLVFNDKAGKNMLLDLTRYSAIAFNTQCTPSNVLSLSMMTFDDKISVPGELMTYRNPAAYFSCEEHQSRVQLDLTRLETPQWWVDKFKLSLSGQAYKLDKVSRISINTTFQSSYGTPSRVQLTDITLLGRDWRYLYVLAGFLLIAWGGYAIWFFRRHSQALIGQVRDKLQRDRPLVAYQQLAVELHIDKERSAILRFMATEYANAQLDLESMVAALGVNRNKINEILKSELGFTFTAYLNKLRLTEAARLLGEKAEANVAEIAYSVGYKNVSYFNKLFKEEYGCPPKAFRNLLGK
jgi:AraC-like DNA-binding protein